MRLKQLVKVLMVERFGSISKAADQIGVAQSALSKSISDLENELGVIIFTRTPKGVILTEAGKEIVRLAKSIATNMDNIQLVAGAKKRLQGELTAALPPAVYNTLAVDILKEFKNMYPQVMLRLIEMGANDASRAIAEGKCDIGMGIFMPEEEERYLTLLGELGVAYTPVAKTRFKLFMSTKNPLANKTEVCLEDIANVSLLEFLSVGTESILINSQRKYSSARHKIYNRETMKKLISMDCGMAFMPAFFEWDDYYIKNGLIIGKYVTNYPERLGCYLLFSQQSMTTPLENAFVILLTHYMERLAK